MHHTPGPPLRGDDPDTIADTIIARVGRDIVLALPLGLGKANHVANALYARAVADPSLALTIVTALTLEKPGVGSDLQGRFMGPVVERVFGGYPELDYARDRRRNALPANVRVEEFFLLAGSQLGNPHAQQNVICANYTHALEYVLARGVNVLAQLVATGPGADHQPAYCLSCNTDLSGDMLAARRAGAADFLFVAQTNDELPFMGGYGEIDGDDIDLLLDSEQCQFPLFAPPREPIAASDYAAAMHIARLIADGGTLQIGIGSMGDAVARCLILRHRHNLQFREFAQALAPGGVASPGDQLEVFSQGLHGVSEMLVESFLDLKDAGVLTRQVAGKVLFGGFFLGARSLYQRLRELSSSDRRQLAMCSVLFANEIYGDEAFKRQQRVAARFVNKAMMATLLGAVVSDGLADGQVISGVGGQYNFAAQAFALAGARSIITLPATRTSKGKTRSNILWSYGNTTLPRHLRDIIVTEYGVADLRGKTDAEVIAAMLAICDSRFQQDLLDQAKSAGKVAADYQIPAVWRNNLPARINGVFAQAGAAELFPTFPFGTDFDPQEQRLLPVLKHLQGLSHSKLRLAMTAARGLSRGPRAEELAGALARLDLASPGSWAERLLQALVAGAWHRVYPPLSPDPGTAESR